MTHEEKIQVIREFVRSRAKKGGEKTKEKYGSEHFKEMAQKSAEKRRENKAKKISTIND